MCVLSNAARMGQFDGSILRLLHVGDSEVFCVFAAQKFHHHIQSSHSSVRHQLFFDIIEYLCRSAVKLQMKSSLMHFRAGLRGQLSCEAGRLNSLLNPFGGSRAVHPILSIGP